MPTYQPLTDRLAKTPLLDRLAREATLQAAFRVMAKCFLMSVPDLTEAERQYLYDLGRDEQRSRHLNLLRLIDFSQRSLNAAHRAHFGELVRAHTYRDVPIPPLPEAIDHEIACDGPAAAAVREFERHPSRETRDAAIAAERERLAAERTLLDSIERTQVA